MKEIERLEAAVGRKIEQWNVEDLEVFSLEENLELLQLLKKSDVISECIERSKSNRDLANIFVPLYIKSQLTEAENEANDVLEKHETGKMSDADLQKYAECNLNDKSVYKRLSAALILVSMFQDYDLQARELILKESIAELKELICGLSIDDYTTCYTLVLDLFDLLFPLRSKYFAKYNIDILDDEDKRLMTVIDNMHTFEAQMMEALQNVLPEDEAKHIIEEINGEKNG